jgi:hypothetical protein
MYPQAKVTEFPDGITSALMRGGAYLQLELQFSCQIVSVHSTLEADTEV